LLFLLFHFYFFNLMFPRAIKLLLYGTLFLFFITAEPSLAAPATTTVRVTICGDGIVGFMEVCDVLGGNDGAYSTSTAGLHCNATCTAFAPYCGDTVLHALYGEECDDGNNLSGDNCTNVCKQEVAPTASGTPATPPPPPSSSGGGFGVRDGSVSIKNPTKVVIDGKAYPSAYVHILQDGKQVGIVPAKQTGDFHFEVSDITPGPVIFGFWAEDSKKTKSITLTTTFQVVQNAVTTVSGVLLPPTIELDKKTVPPGESLRVFGETLPNAQIFSSIDSGNPSASGTAALSDGKWSLTLDTGTLKNEALHSVKAQSEIILADKSAKRSGFSQSAGFYLGTNDTGGTIFPDVNNDGKVNIVDFSILLFYWGTSEATVDFNRDGKVNLTDFSILLFNWTG
jgi:cysteine-rich repeat protein